MGNKELAGTSESPPNLKKVILLENTHYLENYLWPNFDYEKSSPEHILTIILIINEKIRQNLPVWSGIDVEKNVFERFFLRVLSLKESQNYTLKFHELSS